MEDVAARAGVSRALVSLVMNNAPNVSDSRRAAVRQAASELGYRPNLVARSLAQKRTRTVGVVVNDLHNPFFAEVVDGIDDAVEERDLHVLLLNGGRDNSRERRCVETFLQLQVESLVLIGSMLDDEQLRALAPLAPTAVVAGGRPEASVDSVQTDDIRGAEIAVEHLIGLGHERIVHVDGSPNPSAGPRRDGYAAAMRAVGLEPLVVLGGDDEGAAGPAINQILASGELPTAVFAFNDLLAAGILDRLDEAGLRVPEEMSLVGYDNTFIAGLHHLSITTIHQPRREMGELAIISLLERVEHGRTEPVHHTLEPSLVTRASSSPPPAAPEAIITRDGGAARRYHRNVSVGREA
jgi:DNA-binding LacI/PurR family transcriptional regulator